MSAAMAAKRKVGRPRNFDIDAALVAATHVFWEKGYDGASIKDLTEAMGINSPSLYAVFGDKQGLYVQAVKRYMNKGSCAPMEAFESEKDIKKAVRAFMEAVLESATGQPAGRQGCFMSHCVSTSVGTVEGTRELLQEAIASADNRLAARFDAEIAQGHLPETFPSMERAQLMFDLRQGHVLRARAGTRREDMQKDLDYRVAMILQ